MRKGTGTSEISSDNLLAKEKVNKPASNKSSIGVFLENSQALLHLGGRGEGGGDIMVSNLLAKKRLTSPPLSSIGVFWRIPRPSCTWGGGGGDHVVRRMQ